MPASSSIVQRRTPEAWPGPCLFSLLIPALHPLCSLPPHPPSLLPPSLSQRKEREFRARLDTVARLYGVAAAMRMKTEADILSQICRAPGLPSSFVGLETVLGTDETIEFEDVLNDPQDRPDLPMVAVHEKMEARLGL